MPGRQRKTVACVVHIPDELQRPSRARLLLVNPQVDYAMRSVEHGLKDLSVSTNLPALWSRGMHRSNQLSELDSDAHTRQP
jgi:hypothetical protein